MASDQRKQFLFLNQSLASQSQREKELQDADRRAHAARVSRNPRTKRQVPLAGRVTSSSRKRLLKKATHHPNTRIEQEEALPAKSSRKRRLPIRPRTPKAKEESSTRSDEAVSSISPRSLGQGNHDPFDTASVVNLPAFVYGMLDHSFRSVWPTLSCSDPQKEAGRTDVRKRIIREHPFMLHAYIFSASGHRLRHYPPGHPSRTVLTQARSYHERKGSEAVATILSRITGPVPDAILLALFVLVFPAGEYEESVSMYPKSPLAAAQSLDIYGNVDVAPRRIQQIQYLSRLLETRGGLEGVAHLDWVAAILYADAFISSRLSVRPIWHWPKALRYHFDAFKDLVLDPHAFQLSLMLGRGFSCLKSREYHGILMLACRTTLALDLYHREVPVAPKIWEIAMVRVALQNQLCNLDPPTGLVPSHEDRLYDVVRLAALIYSDLVLFPIPDSGGIKPRLAYDLRKALELLDTRDIAHDQDESEIILWCTTMGAMAAYGSVHQECFVEKLTVALRNDERLQDWILFQTLMSQYLWWEYVLQPRCRDVWREAVQVVQPDCSRPHSATD